MNLITPYEVLKHSGAGRGYPTAKFCDLIPQIEEELARECLGPPLYAWLLEKQADAPAGATLYDAAVAYDVGDIVKRDALFFESTAAANTSDPLLDLTKWEQLARFTDAQANTLWARYLRLYLALRVYAASLTAATWGTGAAGMRIAQGEQGHGFRAANKLELVDSKGSLHTEAERVLANMTAWLKTVDTSTGFPQARVCEANTCAASGRRSRRWGFKY